MTLRDYCAAMAMQSHVSWEGEIVSVAGALPAVRIATLAYDIANAMLDERAK